MPFVALAAMEYPIRAMQSIQHSHHTVILVEPVGRFSIKSHAQTGEQSGYETSPVWA